jgi:hypothetical protein
VTTYTYTFTKPEGRATYSIRWWLLGYGWRATKPYSFHWGWARRERDAIAAAERALGPEWTTT